MKKLTEDIDKLYRLSVIKNIVSWNVATDPTEDSYFAEQEAENAFLKHKINFMKKYKDHPITFQYQKSFFPLKIEQKHLELKQILWKKYLELRNQKSNADEEYFVAFENIVNHTKLMLKKKNISAMQLSDDALGSTKDIMYVIKQLAEISKEKLSDKNTHTLEKIERKNVSLEKTFEYLDSFENISYKYSEVNGSFMTIIDKDNSSIHIKYEEDRDENEVAASITHEVGHARYQNKILNKNLVTGKFGDCVSLSLHESSSILNEISCTGLDYKITQNKVLYRLGSHKLIYIIHLYIRLKIEDMLLNENLNVREIPKVWNSLIDEYFGVTPKNDFEGFLQDVHWNSGLFGYFQSYGIGFFNAINMYIDIKDTLPEDLNSITDLVLEKIDKTYGKYNETSSNILNDMYPNIDLAIEKYRNFVNNYFYY